MTVRTNDDAFEQFLELWGRLCVESSSDGTVVVVEGERDRGSLRALGVTGPIHLVHHGLRLGALAQDLARSARRAIVLTDWDATGGQLAQRLRELLSPGIVEVDLEFRRRLARALRGEVVHVEGLHAWARRMAERSGAPLEHFLPPEVGGGPFPTG